MSNISETRKYCICEEKDGEISFLDIYDPDVGHEWTKDLSQAMKMRAMNAETRLKVVKEKHPNAKVKEII